MATYLADVDARALRPDDVDDGERASRRTSPSTRSSRRARCSRSCRSRSTFYASLYGPYPFNAVGAIVDSAKVVGYSLETQTKPNFPYVPDEATLVHELSHMWFGDSVTLTQWPDIWLHEGFATWSEWIWSEHQGNKSAAQWFKQLLQHARRRTRAFWTPPAGNPGTPALLFNGTIYYRGGMTLEALREKVGDLTLLPDHPGLGDAEPLRQRDDAAVHRAGGAASPAMDLAHFFDVWLYQPRQADELVRAPRRARACDALRRSYKLLRPLSDSS